MFLCCGQDRGNANFCPMCGARRPSPSVEFPSMGLERGQLVPQKGKVLKRIMHTFKWQGICPTCTRVHNHEETLCPHCRRGALAVSFEVPRWAFFVFPLPFATMKCTRGCGFEMCAIHCTCDNAPSVTDVHLSFKMPILVTLFHNLVHGAQLLATIVSAAPACIIGLMAYRAGAIPAEHHGMFVTSCIFGGGFLLYFLVETLPKWHRMRSWFSFADVFVSR